MLKQTNNQPQQTLDAAVPSSSRISACLYVGVGCARAERPPPRASGTHHGVQEKRSGPVPTPLPSRSPPTPTRQGQGWRRTALCCLQPELLVFCISPGPAHSRSRVIVRGLGAWLWAPRMTLRRELPSPLEVRELGPDQAPGLGVRGGQLGPPRPAAPCKGPHGPGAFVLRLQSCFSSPSTPCPLFFSFFLEDRKSVV